MGDVTALPQALENDSGGGTTFPVCRSVTKSLRESWGPAGPTVRRLTVSLDAPNGPFQSGTGKSRRNAAK